MGVIRKSVPSLFERKKIFGLCDEIVSNLILSNGSSERIALASVVSSSGWYPDFSTEFFAISCINSGGDEKSECFACEISQNCQDAAEENRLFHGHKEIHPPTVLYRFSFFFISTSFFTLPLLKRAPFILGRVLVFLWRNLNKVLFVFRSFCRTRVWTLRETSMN